jgi:hypothetical protein
MEKSFIAAMEFCISFLEKHDKSFIRCMVATKMNSSRLSTSDAVIDVNISPLEEGR